MGKKTDLSLQISDIKADIELIHSNIAQLNHILAGQDRKIIEKFAAIASDIESLMRSQSSRNAPRKPPRGQPATVSLKKLPKVT